MNDTIDLPPPAKENISVEVDSQLNASCDIMDTNNDTMDTMDTKQQSAFSQPEEPQPESTVQPVKLAPPPKVNPWLQKQNVTCATTTDITTATTATTTTTSSHQSSPKSILKNNSHKKNLPMSFESIMKEQAKEHHQQQQQEKKKKVTILDDSNNEYLNGETIMDEEEMIRLAIEASLQDQQNQQLQYPKEEDEDLNTKPSHLDSTASTYSKNKRPTSPPLLKIAAPISNQFATNHYDNYHHDVSSVVALPDMTTSKTATTSATGGGGGLSMDDTDLDEDMKLAIQLSLQEQQQPTLPQSITTTTMNNKTDTATNVLSSLSTMATIEEPIFSCNDTTTTTASLKTPYNENENEYEHDDDEPKKLPPSTALAATSTIATTTAAATATSTATTQTTHLSKEEEEQIAKAILQADDEEMAKSIQLAMKIQQEEEENYKKYKQKELELQMRNGSSGATVSLGNAESHVRLVSHDEYESIRKNSHDSHDSITNEFNTNHIGGGGEKRQLFGKDDYDLHEHYYGHENNNDEETNNDTITTATTGFQINSTTTSSSKWTRYDRNTIIGPNNEIRTKHDIDLKHQANADKLLSQSTSTTPSSSFKNKKQDRVSVSDVAYNSFHQSLKHAMKKRSTVKGVAAHGTGRAENMNAEQTRGGAMDGNVRLLISKAITNGLIQYCNGVVKEGKEAVVYHANGGSGNGSDHDDRSMSQNEMGIGMVGEFDVAVKVFKRIQEFRGRGAYLDGDPRYHGQKFRNIDKREQVELWTEKEYRNLIRANRAGVPVPTPLMQKENVLFMRFLGEDGWPAPQLREIELKKKSKKWTALYIQTMVAIRRLYHCAKLVHADLSEYNILVCPMSQVENALDKSEDAKEALQIVLIDFGQAVEIRHPSADDLLRRDLTMTKAFYDKQGIKTLSLEESEEFVLKECHFGVEEEVEEDDEDDDVCDGENDDEAANVVDEGKNDEEKLDEKNGDIMNEVEEEAEREEVNQWRHSISGWDDLKDMEYIETRLAQLSIDSQSTTKATE